MSKKKFFTLAISVSLSWGTARAEKTEVECPEEIKTKQTQVAPIKGWSTHVETVNARQIFTGLEMFNGHPKDGAPLFSDETGPDKPTTPSLTPPTGTAPAPGGTAPSAEISATDTVYKIPAGHEAYVSCQYTNTLVRLIKKLPKGVQTCRVRFSEALGHVQKAVCE